MPLWRWFPRYRFQVSGSSMEPAYPDGRHVWVSGLAFLFRAPVRGDVVVVHSPTASDRLELKRIIGLPGEKIAWSRGAFRVNDVMLEELYARIPAAPPSDDETRHCRLGCGQYFVAGDNRPHSTDSRAYGPIPRVAIAGQVRC